MDIKNIKESIKKIGFTPVLFASWYNVTVDDIPIISSITSVQSAYDNAMKIVNWVIGLGAFVAVVMVLYGGVTYIISAGDSDKTKQAQGTATNALIALVVLFLLRTILAFIIERVTNGFK